MNKNIKFAGALAALCTSLAGIPAADASILLSNTGSSDVGSFISMADMFDPTFQPLATISVSQDVSIGGWGVNGQAFANNTQLMWVLFKDNNLELSPTGTVTPTNTAGWFNSPLVDYTLKAGHTYAMGVVSSAGFGWSRDFSGYDPDTAEPITGVFPAITQNFITLQPIEATAQVTWDPASSTGAVDRAAYADTAGFRSSIQIFSAGDFGGGPTPPVPEPAEWSMLLAGLLVVAFVANRQRRQPV